MKWYRVVKKLRLQKPAAVMLSPFCGRSEAMTSEQAEQILSEVYPDRESFCVLPEKRRWDAPVCDLSVLIPVYNNGAYIESCLSSVLDQETDFTMEIIVVNDGSTDDTAEKLKHFEKEPKVTVIHQNNGGVSVARNAAVDRARGRYILFLDGDDAMLPGTVQCLMQSAMEHKAAVAEGGYEIVDLNGRKLQHFGHKSGLLDPAHDMWEKIGFPPKLHYEDSIMAQILWEKASAEGKTAWGVDQAVGSYRINPQGFTESSKRSVSCIDTVWITKLLMREREKLGLTFSQYYYEHLLDMAALSWIRTEMMEKRIRKAVFTMYREFLLSGDANFRTTRSEYQALEQAIRDGHFERFELICSLR